MIYIDMRNWFATFWSVYSHSFKGLSTEQDDEKSHNCVYGQVFHRKYKRLLWPFMLAVNVLQNNLKGHWEVKIISLAAEGT